jgi:release factor glutamine methyltransferase
LKNPKPDEILRRVLETISQGPSNLYSPREDTYLMIDAVRTAQVEGKRVLDLGTGSGILGLYCALRGAHVTAADIDDQAVRHATEAAKRLGVKLQGITSDLFSNIPYQFDLILFNPPYLPSVDFKDRTVDGGPEGRVVINKFLSDLSGHLAKNGVAYLLISSLNDPASITTTHTRYVFNTVAKRSLFFEELQILCARLRNNFSS